MSASISAAVQMIRNAGFQMEVEGDSIAIEPFDELSDDQLEWLRSNKAEILNCLRQSDVQLEPEQSGSDLTPANDPTSLLVECWTPSGIRRLVYADSHEHAEWIRAANPKPPMVTCADCDHATITSGIARCGAGVDSGLPTGGFWATDRHLCDQFEEARS